MAAKEIKLVPIGVGARITHDESRPFNRFFASCAQKCSPGAQMYQHLGVGRGLLRLQLTLTAKTKLLELAGPRKRFRSKQLRLEVAK